MRYEKCVTCSKTVGWVGLITNSLLMVMKLFIGLISGSQAMVADAMYSAKDLISSVLVIIGMTVSTKPLDEEHPYGHGKVEFILSFAISVVFMIVTGYLLVHAISTLLITDNHRAPHMIALWAALLSVAVNVFMYYYSRCVSIESNSPMVRTLAKHHHADATASAGVAAGIVGAHYLNMPWIDPMIAVIETIHLLYLGGDVFWDSFKGLMDRSLSPKAREGLEKLIATTDGVQDVRYLRSRRVGQEIWAEIVIGVDPEITIDEAYDICDAVKRRILHRVSHVGHLTVNAETGEVSEELRLAWEKDHPGMVTAQEG
ncbi:cation diffusion facilitator family transporter [Magnetospira thiophila]